MPLNLRKNLRKFARALTNIRNTPTGKEASMYPYIRDVFLAMGHQDNLVITDSRNSAGGRPDVAVEVRDLAVRLSPWIVVEAKDEPGTFSDEKISNRIFAEKWRYVSADTEWFVGIDPSAIRLRKVTHFEKPTQPSADEVILLGEQAEVLASKLAPLGVEAMKVNRARLNAFREGAEGTFSRIAIDGDKVKALFLSALKSAAQDLIVGAKAAL